MRVSEKAVIARINRKLAHMEQKLHKSRRWDSDIRNYYIIGWRFNTLVASYDSLEQVAKCKRRRESVALGGRKVQRSVCGRSSWERGWRLATRC